MAPENYTVELNEAAWDLIITALEVYCASYLDEFLKDSEYLEICAACGFQGNEAKIIPAIIYEIESQTTNNTETMQITMYLQQWVLVTYILNDFYDSVAECEDVENEEIPSEITRIIDLGITPKELENYLDAMEVILDELELITDGAPISATLN